MLCMEEEKIIGHNLELAYIGIVLSIANIVNGTCGLMHVWKGVVSLIMIGVGTVTSILIFIILFILIKYTISHSVQSKNP